MDLFYFVLLWWGHPSIIFGLLFIQEIPGFKQIQGLESEKRQGLFNHGNSNQPFISENQSFVFACEGSFCISVRTPVALATSWLIYYWPSSLQVIHFDWYSKFTTVHGKHAMVFWFRKPFSLVSPESYILHCDKGIFKNDISRHEQILQHFSQIIVLFLLMCFSVFLGDVVRSNIRRGA